MTIKASFIALCSACLFSCMQTPEKETIESNQIFEKNSIVSDDFLINAINGNEPDYIDIENLLELLLDNSSLSENVLKSIIDQSRLQNDFVELCIIVSAPHTVSLIQYAKFKRPGMKTENIELAQSKIEHNMSFSIINEPIQKIVFGKDLKRLADEGCFNACSSIFQTSPGNPIYMISWGNTGTAGYISVKCNERKWICGDPVRLHHVDIGTDIIICENSRRKCIRYVQVRK